MTIRPRRRMLSRLMVLATAVVLVAAAAILTSVRSYLYPEVDKPDRVDAIVVMAGVNDDRYAHALKLAESGVADHVLVSRPVGSMTPYTTAIDAFCSTPLSLAVHIECFSPDSNTTEGEATAVTSLAHERGWRSLLAVTYWGHVQRVRIYLDQCFEGMVFVTDTPNPSPIARRSALLHESGGYIKAILKPAC